MARQGRAAVATLHQAIKPTRAELRRRFEQKVLEGQELRPKPMSVDDQKKWGRIFGLVGKLITAARKMRKKNGDPEF